MKNTILFFALFSISLLIGNNVKAQCTPGDAISCPDPENNGEVCPAVLPAIFIGAQYDQQFTVLAPPKLDTNNLVINLHHITLINVENLPEGITWQSNATNNEFFVGTYYCVLLSGITSADPGIYPIKIVVDIYTSIAGVPVLLGRTTDSTSLTVEVGWNPNAISDHNFNQFNLKTWPNPFSQKLNVQLNQYSEGQVVVEIFNLLGSRVLYQNIVPSPDGNFEINTSFLNESAYLLRVLYDEKVYSRMISGRQ
jgi:hypothetical protein